MYAWALGGPTLPPPFLLRQAGLGGTFTKNWGASLISGHQLPPCLLAGSRVSGVLLTGWQQGRQAGVPSPHRTLQLKLGLAQALEEERGTQTRQWGVFPPTPPLPTNQAGLGTPCHSSDDRVPRGCCAGHSHICIVEETEETFQRWTFLAVSQMGEGVDREGTSLTPVGSGIHTWAGC